MRKFLIFISIVIFAVFIGIRVVNFDGQKSEVAVDSGVEGIVLLGPQCPVQRIGDTSCDDKPYPTSIEIFREGSDRPYKIVQTDEGAFFKAELEPDVYVVKPQGGRPFPHCSERLVEVFAGEFIEVTLLCDTGIR